MRLVAAFLLVTSVASAYITPSDQVVVDGRILLTNSRPLAVYPWRGEPPRLSEYPDEERSDARELAAIWQIAEGRLFLLAVSGYRFDGFAPRRAVGLADLMPERLQNGRVFAEWYTGSFEVIERERIDQRILIRPDAVTGERFIVRKFLVTKGHVAETLPASANAPAPTTSESRSDAGPNGPVPDEAPPAR